jgi:competence protein ComEC
MMRETLPGKKLSGIFNRHPLLWAAVVTTACVATASWSAPLAFILAALIGFLGAWICNLGVGFAWLCCGWLSVSVFTLRSDAQKWDEMRLLGVEGVEIEGRVLQDPPTPDDYWSVPVVILKGEHAGAKVWWEGRGLLPVAGARVKATGSFERLPTPRNPGEFDKAAWLRRKGVAAVFDARSLVGGLVVGKWAAFGARVRHGFRHAISFGLPEDSAELGVIRAMVIGEQPPASANLVSAFRNSGTLHAFSVSGLHVAMVGSIGWLLLRAVGLPRRSAVLLLIPLIFAYAWITGNNPPAVRSAWMALVFLGAFITRRKPDLLNALGAVLLVAMLWDGRLLFQPGVQLSYGVVAAIAIGTAWASRAFSWISKAELHLPMEEMSWWQRKWLGFRGNLAQSFSVSLAAGVGSAPLTAFHFQLFTPVSVIAGVVLLPVVYLLLSASLLAAALYPFSPTACRWVNQANSRLAQTCFVIADRFASIPGSHFQLQTTEPSLMVYDLSGGANAACFSGGESGGVLLDCGSQSDLKYRIAPSLRRLGIVPDSVVLSHPDGSHLGGGLPVWESFPIRQAIIPVLQSRSPNFRAWLDGAPAAGIRLIDAASVDRLNLPDGAVLEILHSPEPGTNHKMADDRVVIYKIHWHGWKFLFTSDSGVGTELKLLASGKDLSADVIIAGKHRWDASLCDPFLQAVNPKVIIASHSDFPQEEKLSPNTVSYWQSIGIHVFNQGETGGVTLRLTPQRQLRIDGFVDGSSLTLHPRG